MAIVTRETDYALRALVHLARTEGFAPVSELAGAEGVPQDFLRKIMQTLTRAGITASRQGAYGGYRLAGDPREVSLLDVVEAVQGPLTVNECFETPGICDRVCHCPFREQLGEMQEMLNAKMAGTTLQDIVEQMPAGERSAQ